MLIIPAFHLYPIDSGGAHAQLAVLEKLQYQQQVDLVIRPENIDEKDIPSFRARFPGLNLLLTGYTPQSKGQKIMAFIKKARRKISGRDPSYRLRKYGLLNALIRTRPDVLEEIKQFALAGGYDIIQAEHSINMGLVELLPEKPKKVFVHHEILHTRIQSDMLSHGYSRSAADHISGIAWKMEKGWLDQYDGVITLCREDAGLLQLRGVELPMQVAQPFALFEEELKNVYDAALPPKLLFVGGESHYPNKEGLSWFLREVYPAVCQQYSGCSIRITGSWSAAFKDQFKGDATIQFAGFVRSLDEVYRDSILVAPVRIGSGIRIKVITALAHGVPVVGTTVGVSGIPGVTDGMNALLADDAVNFAGKLVSLLNDTGLRKQLSQKGFLLAQEGYNQSAFAGERTKFYEQLLNRNPGTE